MQIQQTYNWFPVLLRDIIIPHARTIFMQRAELLKTYRTFERETRGYNQNGQPRLINKMIQAKNHIKM